MLGCRSNWQILLLRKCATRAWYPDILRRWLHREDSADPFLLPWRDCFFFLRASAVPGWCLGSVPGCGASARCQLAVLGRAARGSWRGQTPGPPAAHTAPTHSDGGESGTRGGRPHRAERCMRVSCSHHCLPTTHQKDGENGISYCFSDFSIDHLLVT